jgi:hypothetical protein
MDSKALVWTDRDGRKWSTRLEIPEARKLKAAGFDIRNWPELQKTLANPERFLDYAVEYFRPQWSAGSLVLDEVEFMVLLTATETSLAEAKDAIVAGMADFFRRCGDEKFAAVLEKAIAVGQIELQRTLAKINGPTVDEATAKMLDKFDAEFDKKLDAEVENFGASLAKRSASAESATEPG